MPSCLNFLSPPTNQGLTDNTTTFMEDHADAVEHIEDEYLGCKVIPLSRATPDETGINNGTVTSITATFFVRDKGCRLGGGGALCSVSLTSWGEVIGGENQAPTLLTSGKASCEP